ncbi:MAG: rhodanese-like domain-containing protein [Pseudohongiellaceae bacterium]
MFASLQLLLMASLFGWFGVNWEAIDDRITREYPAVAPIEQLRLHELLQAAPAERPLLIDVRETEEFAVSRLPGAENLQTARAVARRIPDRDAPIVVYCSVGYRSAGVASGLAELGYTNVRNLRHSIFAWADAGRPLVNGGGATDKVHPFNAVWGSLVDSTLHSYSPVRP